MCPSLFFSYRALTGDSDDVTVVLFWRVCDVFQVLHVPPGLGRFMTRADPASVTADECSDGEHHFTQRAKKRVAQPEGSRRTEMGVKKETDNKCLLSTLLHYTHTHTAVCVSVNTLEHTETYGLLRCFNA